MRVFLYRITTCFSVSLLTVFCLKGQNISPNIPSCGFDEMTLLERMADPTIEGEIRDFTDHALPELSSQNRGAVEPLMTISVVVHVIHEGEPVGQGRNISDGQVEDQIAILNEDFWSINEKYYQTPTVWFDLAGTPNIQFLLATIDPNGNPTNGITRHNIPVTGPSWSNNNINSTIKPATKWDPLRYMNIYVVSIPGTTAAGGVVGYSNYPITSLIGADRDGPVIDYNWFGAPGHPVSGWRPITHETGHYLGLPHTFSGSSCNNDDGISDTPNIDDATSAYATLDCSAGFPTAPQSCGNDHLYVNYMDYVEENCYTSFTQGQVNVMRSVLDGTSSGLGYGSRKSLVDNAPMQAMIPVHDAGITRIVSPEMINCTADELAPTVLLRNFGSADLTQVSINYQVDNGPLTSYIWQGSLFPGESTEVVLPAFTPPDGVYDMVFQTSSPNAVPDNRVSNDAFEATFRTYFAFDPPMIEPADGATDFPTSFGTFQFNFDSDDFAWEISNEVSAYGIGTESFVFNNRAGTVGNNPSDTYDILVTRHFDFSEVNSAALYFDYAHATYNNLQVDTLYILVAVGCSQNFDTYVYKKSGNDLATAPPTQNVFTPISGDWKTEGVDLSFFDGMDDVTIGFLNVSNWGNRLFIDNIRVGVDCALLSDDWDFTPNGCDGGCSGTATVSVPISNGALSYEWEGWPVSHNEPTVLGLCAGEATVTITDEFGCQILASQDIPQAPSPVLDFISTQETGFQTSDGSATVTVHNATNPITYVWSNGVIATNSDSSHTISGLMPGMYDVEVTDANSCSVTEGVMVSSVCSGFDANISSSDVKCNGGSDGTATAMPLNGNGSFTYLWSNDVSTPSNNSLNVGMHTVTITDANGCLAIKMFTISEPTPLIATISATNETSVNAMDGTATASATGGNQNYTYLWNTGAVTPTITGLAPGNYAVTATDANGCTSSESVTIQSVDCNDFAVLISWDNVSCFGLNDGSALVTVSGETAPVIYSWSNGGSGNMIEDLIAGTYTVTVMDAAGCSAELTASVQEPTELTLSLSATGVSMPSAIDGTATANPSGGTPLAGGVYQYNWDNGGTAQTITGLSAGIYTVVVTDFNGCTNSGEVEVTAANCQLSLQVDFENASCPNVADGSAIVTEVPGAASPVTYLWSNGGTGAFIENLLPGDYFVTITDANGCTVNGWVPITGNDETAPTIILVDQIFISIENDPVNFDPTSADNGSSDNCSMVSFESSQILFDCSDIGENQIIITATDGNGNMSTANLLVVVEDGLPPVIACPADISVISCDEITYAPPTADDNCALASLELVEGFESGQHFPIGTTTVTYEARDASGNISNCSFEAVIDYDLSFTDAIILNPSCAGFSDGSVDLFVGGGQPPFQSIWSHGGGPTNLSAGDYSVTLNDSNGCSIEESFVLADPPLLVINLVDIIPAMGGVQTGSILISLSGGINPFDITWFENGLELPGFDPLHAPPGTYSVSVTDSAGCMVEAGPFLVDNLNSIVSKELERQILLYPNPTNGLVSVKANASLTGTFEISVFDVNGKKRFDKKMNFSQVREQLDFSHLVAGVFWVKMVIGNEVVWKKLIVV